MALLHLNEAGLQKVLESGAPVLVDFWATWCNPCQQLSPVIEALAKEYDGRAIVGKVDVDGETELARRYKVMSIPTVLLFKNGEQVARKVGVMPPEVYREELDQLLGS